MQVRTLKMCEVLLSVKIYEIIRSVKKCEVLLNAGAGVGDVQQRGGWWPGAGLGGGRGRQVSSSTS